MVNTTLPASFDHSARYALRQVPVPLGARLTAQSVLFLRILLRRQGLAEGLRKRAAESVAGPSIGHDRVRPHHLIEVPRIAAGDLSPKTLNAALCAGVPTVLEGAAKDSLAVRTWSPEFLQTRYGDVPVPMWSEHSSEPYLPLGECIRQIVDPGADTKVQVNNACSLFTECPELLRELPIEALGKSIERLRYHGANLFVCSGDSGSKYHCANEVNLFIQVYGEKEWFFVHPYYTPQMDPLVTFPKGNYFASGVDWGSQPSRVPIGRALLRPGDMLINPPWWWHWVQNRSVTVGVATRWLSWRHRFGTANRYFSALQWLYPHQWKIKRQDYLGDGKLNEHKWVHAD